jgi:hypothetical protein
MRESGEGSTQTKYQHPENQINDREGILLHPEYSWLKK